MSIVFREKSGADRALSRNERGTGSGLPSNWKELLYSPEKQELQVLVLCSDETERAIIGDCLQRSNAKVTVVQDVSQAVTAMHGSHFDMFVTDLCARLSDTLELVSIARETSPEMEAFVVVSHTKLQDAVECVRRGAEGFMIRPEIEAQLTVAIQRVKNRRQLRRLAYTDGLTSLFNRQTFQHFLRQECNRSGRHHRSFGLLMLDIDEFKQYNDLYGHLLGDIALIKLGTLLKDSTRASDIPARYGGDEFAAILVEASASEASLLANRIRQMVSLAQFQYAKDLPARRLTVSIGLALYPEHGSDVYEIIRSADRALYRAKAEGRDRVCIFEPATGDNLVATGL